MMRSIVIIALFLTSCLKAPVNKNLDKWEGTWEITKVVEPGIGGFIKQPYDNGELIVEDYGHFVFTENGYGELYVKNTKYSDTLEPVVYSFYLSYEGNYYLHGVGTTVKESANPDVPVGWRIGEDGNFSLLIDKRGLRERVLKVEGLYDLFKFDVTVDNHEYFWFLKKK